MTSLSTADAQWTVADLDHLHATLGLYARQLWDIQKARIMAGNRVGAFERDGFPINPTTNLRQTADALASIEAQLNRDLEKLARQHFMADWIKQAPGIGLPGFARLLAVTGPLDQFPTVSKLWKFLGMAVQDGHAPRREKGVGFTHTDCQFRHLERCPSDCATNHHPNCVPGGVGTAYSPQGRVLCHQLAESIVKVGRGPYREAYDRKKAEYEAGRPDWTQAHRHNAAMRYAIKAFLRDLWVEWQRRRKVLHEAA